MTGEKRGREGARESEPDVKSGGRPGAAQVSYNI